MIEKSNLPDLEEIRKTMAMRIEQVIISDCPTERVDVNVFEIVDGEASRINIDLYRVPNRLTGGFLPSKCFVTYSDLVMTFYKCDQLPASVRCFGDQDMYVFTIVVPPNVVIEYDAEWRMFIDHILNGDSVVYVFAFAADMYDKIVFKENINDDNSNDDDNDDQRQNTTS